MLFESCNRPKLIAWCRDMCAFMHAHTCKVSKREHITMSERVNELELQGSGLFQEGAAGMCGWMGLFDRLLSRCVAPRSLCNCILPNYVKSKPKTFYIWIHYAWQGLPTRCYTIKILGLCYKQEILSCCWEGFRLGLLKNKLKSHCFYCLCQRVWLCVCVNVLRLSRCTMIAFFPLKQSVSSPKI